MQFYFIRHGQSENNALWKRTGSTNGYSSELGCTLLRWDLAIRREQGSTASRPEPFTQLLTYTPATGPLDTLSHLRYTYRWFSTSANAILPKRQAFRCQALTWSP